MMTLRQRRWAVGSCAGVAMGAITLVLFRRGPVQFLDAGSYAAAIDNMRHGNGLTARLAPSFSNFSSTEFVRRHGEIPFVDFPLGYPLVAAIPALIVGTRHAMVAVGAISIAVLAATVAIGPSRRRNGGEPGTWLVFVRALLGVGLVCLPMFQAVTRAGLSEPVFCALLVMALKLMLDGDAQPNRTRWALVIAGLAGAIRFVGLPIVVLPTLLMMRSSGWRKTAIWATVAVTPAAANVVWASAVGSGHVAGARALSRTDLRFFVHSIGGWTHSRYGVFNLLLSGTAGPPIWAYALALVWLVGVVVAVISLLARRAWLPRPIELALVLAGVLTAGLVLGMAFFDSLVAPDNRLMLPAGIVTLCGLGWWATERVKLYWAAAIVVAWATIAAVPWRLHTPPRATSNGDLVAAVGSAPLAISDDADQVWWQTGARAAYLPQPLRLLTGEPVDQRAELQQLPCLLYAERGVIVLLGGPFVDHSAVALLDELVVAGQLNDDAVGSIRRFSPTGQGC